MSVEPCAIQLAFVPTVYEVRSRRNELHDVATLSIAPLPAASLPQYAPGQFNMLYVQGAGEIPVSISGTAANGAWLHTIRAVGNVSAALCKLKKGDQLGVRGPFGTAWPVEQLAGRSVIIMAGGLGLAPLRPAISYLMKHRDRFGRILICYGARTPRDALFAGEWQRWGSVPNVDFQVTVDRTSDPWEGHVGVVTALLPRALSPGPWSALICGPEVMMRHCAQDLLRLGVGSDDIFVSLERNMKCAIGLCGHCQLNRFFVCRDGPVFTYAAVEALLRVKEL